MKDIVKKIYTVDPEQGAVALLTRMSLPGYRVQKIDRKGTKATVTYEKVAQGKK